LRSRGGTLFVCAVVALAASAWAALDPARASVALLLAVLAVLAGGAAALEGSPDSAKDLTLVATVAGLAAAGRILFAAVPGVQPVTVVTVAAGAALGPRRGFAVGAVAALVSNFFLGQGPWTPWQMLAWGLCGLVGGLAAPLLRGRLAFALACFVLGLGFSALMDVWNWYSFWPHTWQSFTLLMARGVPFDLAHALGNFVLALAAGPELRRVLERYDRRQRTEVVWA
jgi:energy-coupling factor transport system substrate-specific component